MKTEIKNKIDNPKDLEKLYRDNKVSFKKAFDEVYAEIIQHPAAQVWHERLHFENEKLGWGQKNELFIVIILSLVAGLIAKIPDYTTLKPEYFYPRHLGFVFLPMLATYFIWKQSLSLKKIIPIIAVVALSAAYINFLPSNESDSIILACIHLPLLLWATWGYAFTGEQYGNYQQRIGFLRFNGEWVVMTTVILIAGGILSGVTVGLFSIIGVNIEKIYFPYVAIWGLSAAPIVATYLLQSNPNLVKNVSPIIAKVFTPLVLTMLLVYLAAIVYTGKDPYNDREFLLIFNILLLGVMAIILFSVAETTKNSGTKINLLLLLSLSITTIVINGIALSAIVFRISEWGITPNRVAVLGSNVLILINLTIMAYRLFTSLRNENEIQKVENSIAAFLPVYTGWTAFVVFILPLLFNFK